MASENGQTPRKLVYLRDRTPRAGVKPRKVARRSETGTSDELATEGVWLGRSLIVVSASALLYWLMIVTGQLGAESDEARHWLNSLSVAYAFIALNAVAGAVFLLRDARRAMLYVALAAGGLIVIALEGLAHLVVIGELQDLGVATRVEILTKAAALAVGVWASSYVLRYERRHGPPA